MCGAEAAGTEKCPSCGELLRKGKPIERNSGGRSLTSIEIVNVVLSFLMPFVGIQIVLMSIPALFLFRGKMPLGIILLIVSPIGFVLGAVLGVINAVSYYRKKSRR